MNLSHRTCTVLLLAALATPSLAQQPDNTVFCKKQAQDITREIVKLVLPDLSADQRTRVQAAAVQACLKLITADPGLAQSAKKNSSADWFTNYVLHGKPADKPGNRRLEHLK
jgi:hypothetical protein